MHAVIFPGLEKPPAPGDTTTRKRLPTPSCKKCSHIRHEGTRRTTQTRGCGLRWEDAGMISVSRIRTVLLGVALLSVSDRAAADTIVLKNGRRLVALRACEEGAK